MCARFFCNRYLARVFKQKCYLCKKKDYGADS